MCEHDSGRRYGGSSSKNSAADKFWICGTVLDDDDDDDDDDVACERGVATLDWAVDNVEELTSMTEYQCCLDRA